MAQRLTRSLLDSLATKEQRVELPILKHSERWPSGRRGLSGAAIEGVRAFYAQYDALDKIMADVCKEPGLTVSVCEMTKSTGLSLAESLVLVADKDQRIEEVVGEATSFFSYSWTGTKLRDMLDAIARELQRLEKDGKRRFVWVDMFCASQPLLAGVYHNPNITKESDLEAYKARKEDTNRIFDDAIAAVSETLFYMEPLASEWRAPPHPFLLAEQGEPEEGWMRHGPAALTRAWCIFELGKTLAKGCTLHVLLKPESVELFEERMTKENNEFEDKKHGFTWIGELLGGIDVKLAQITKTEDREYILGEVSKLEGGMAAINSNVMGALREWLTTHANALLERTPKKVRGTSVLIDNVAMMLKDCGRLADAEVLQREELAAHRAKGGERARKSVTALSNLANNLYYQGKLSEAEPLYRESLAASRETLGNNHKRTQGSIGRLGQVLQEQGKLDEAEPLCVEAAAWFRKDGQFLDQLVVNVGSLVELRRQQGRLAEAEEELGSLVADARAGLGPQHMKTLVAEAIAARLKHAQPDGGAEGAAELRAVVEKMGEFLGAAHQETVKWRVVLDETQRSC